MRSSQNGAERECAFYERFGGLLYAPWFLQPFRDLLAEPWLLDTSLIVPYCAAEVPLAIPVGDLRRGGGLQFYDRVGAENALEFLRVRNSWYLPGDRLPFPDPRIVELLGCFELQWGDPRPFDGYEELDSAGTLLLGIYFGYRTEAIVDKVQYCMLVDPEQSNQARNSMISLIEDARPRAARLAAAAKSRRRLAG